METLRTIADLLLQRDSETETCRSDVVYSRLKCCGKFISASKFSHLLLIFDMRSYFINDSYQFVFHQKK